MPIAVRSLDVVSDESLFRESYGWVREYPLWFREMDKAYPVTLKEYLKRAAESGQADFGIFNGGEMVGVITFALCQQHFVAHVAVRRGTSRAPLLTGARAIVREVFARSRARAIYGWVATRNRGLLNFVADLGFEQTNVLMLRGTMRGRPIEWVQVAIGR